MKTYKTRLLLTILIILSFSDIDGQNATSTNVTNQQTEVRQLTAGQIAEYDRLRTDWANLSKYREENAKAGLPVSGENRVVFMGNSITEFWSRTDPEFFAGKPFHNRGISGQTTPQMLVRFRQDVIALQPKVVVILAGINDIAGNTGASTLEMIEDNLESMVEIALANNIKVILSSVLPAYDFPWRPGMEPAGKVVLLNKWIKDYAEKKGVIYLDYFSAMTDDKNAMKAGYSNDGVHPNLAGYKVMEPLLEKAILSTLK